MIASRVGSVSRLAPEMFWEKSSFYGIVTCVSVTPKIALVVVNVWQCVLKRYSL